MEGLGKMVDRDAELEMLEGFEVRTNGTKIPILQYADVTLFFCSALEDQIINLKHLLFWFEIVSGLMMKVNFEKCFVVGINMEERAIMERSEALGCVVSQWPMNYLGMPLGDNPRKVFRILVKISSVLEKLMRDFLWELGEERKDHKDSFPDPLSFLDEKNMAYYKISHVDGRITNPEQRIASDIPRFCSELSDLIQEDLIAVTDGLLYTWRLCSYASSKYVFWILAYVTGAGAMIGNFSPAFGKLMSKEQQLEGEYRQLHSRLRTHAESIAFYGGENREESHIQQKFKTLVRHMKRVLHDHWWFGMIQDFLLKYLGATVAVVLIIEPFFAGNLRPDSSTLGRAEMLSNLRYHTSVIISLFQSLGTLSISSRRLNRLRLFRDPLLVCSCYQKGVKGSHLNLSPS
ncbi:PREDICTED: ABC transporter D family member 1-like [Nelumbo nucifera]|uniref:ABC transporter D family member 1-like n=1 Tax=Nelumbo nucifera TaxID=4432 RepID=A0A1U7ZIP4_NELNU|nr:PREDICTED: ABC transporter D family member 1-like [Nelumbo nucifera]